MARGPERLRRALAALPARTVRAAGPEPADEVAAVRRANRALAAEVRRAVATDRTPLVLAGDCNSALGTVAGLGRGRVGAVWFDAHGDFNTPATSPSGFLDGMALAIVAGFCHEPLWRDQPWLPVKGSRMLHAAGRDFDRGERQRLAEAGVQVVGADQLRKGGLDALGPALDVVGQEVQDAYLHVDLDALDPAEGTPNQYAAPGGITLRELERALDLVASRLRVRAAAVTAYDPAADKDGRALRAGAQVATRLSRLLG
jgi:arginase